MKPSKIVAQVRVFNRKTTSDIFENDIGRSYDDAEIGGEANNSFVFFNAFHVARSGTEKSDGLFQCQAYFKSEKAEKAAGYRRPKDF